MLEKLVQAVTAVEHRKAAYGRGKAAGQPETGIDDVAQVTGTALDQSQILYSIKSLCLLKTLWGGG
jgi:hypothetical protein